VLAAAASSGVERLWFTSGSEITSLQEASAEARSTGLPAPAVMTCTHEHVALTAAMGDTLVSGGPSMTAAHADLGLLHHGGAIHNAMWGDHPILILSGYPATTESSRSSPVFWKQQRWDPGEIVRQYVKWDYRLGALDDSALVTARGLQLALSPRPGPVYLALPEEVGRRPSYWDGVDAPALGIPSLGAGDDGVIAEVAARLLHARRPLVITDRVGDDVHAVPLLASLAERFGVEVQSSRYRMSLPDDSPWHAGSKLAEYDVVLVLDHPVPWVPTSERPAPSAWVAWIGPDPVESRVPLHEMRADVRTVASVAAFLTRLLATMEDGTGTGDAERLRERLASPPGPRQNGEPGRVDGVPTPSLVAQALSRHLRPEDLLTWEVVDTSEIRRTQPGTLFEKGGSSLGWSVAAATGARIGSGGRPAYALCGDGSYMFGSPDSCLWLQQQHGAPVVTVIVNNGGYRTGTTTLAAHYPQGWAVQQETIAGGHVTPSPDFAGHARSQGCFGEKVVQAAELLPALERARQAVERSGVPAVLDVWVPEHLTGSMDPARRGLRHETEGSSDD
jgi:acetolactate synthase-1/2/3 large subunit